MREFFGEFCSGDGFENVSVLADFIDFIRAEPRGSAEAVVAATGHADLAAEFFGQRDKHQANRPRAQDEDVLALVQTQILDALDDTSEGFSQGGVFKGSFGLEAQHVFLDEAGGDGDALGIGAVEENQVFAKVFLLVFAVKAGAAGRGIGHNHTVAHLPARRQGVRSVADRGDFRDGAGQFVSEGRRGREHFGVVASFEDLQIGPASEGNRDLNTHFAGFEGREGDFFNPNISFPVKNSRFH